METCTSKWNMHSLVLMEMGTENQRLRELDREGEKQRWGTCWKGENKQRKPKLIAATYSVTVSVLGK